MRFTLSLMVPFYQFPGQIANGTGSKKSLTFHGVKKIIPRLDLEIAGSLLSCMASGLKTVQSADAWQEVYFEIDQRIADPAPVGKIATEDINR